MKLILGGGGSGRQTVKANKLFDDIIDNESYIFNKGEQRAFLGIDGFPKQKIDLQR